MAPKFTAARAGDALPSAVPAGGKSREFTRKSKRSMSVGELEKRSKPRTCSLADDFGDNRRTLGSETALHTAAAAAANKRERKTSTYARFMHFCRKFRHSLTGGTSSTSYSK